MMYQLITSYQGAHAQAKKLFAETINGFIKSMEASRATRLDIKLNDDLELHFADIKLKITPYAQESSEGFIPAAIIYQCNKYWPDRGYTLVADIFFKGGSIKPRERLHPEFDDYYLQDDTSVYYFIQHLLGKAIGIKTEGA